MNWKHSCSDAWLDARREYLTASELKSLMTDYKKLKAGKIKLMQAQQFAKVYGQKRNMFPDGESFGPAARGHIMEPHAIDDYNKFSGGDFMFWWDDCVVFDDRKKAAFSPDAMNVKQPLRTVRAEWDPVNSKLVEGGETPTEMLEIKSYESGTHFQRLAMHFSGAGLDERWQVAMAMYVCESIKKGRLMFYAPQANSEFTVEYTRASLKSEIKIVGEIVEMWRRFKGIMDSMSTSGTSLSEGQIYEMHQIDEML